MSSLIEQAAARLEQLRQAGVELPEIARESSASALAPTLRPEADWPAAATASPQPPIPGAQYAPHARAPEPTGGGSSQSRRVDLDLAALSERGMIVPNSPRSRLADEYRVVKRPLIANAMGRGAAAIQHANLIMVTSALAGEGKSFTSINLAMSIAAELDHTVMLVDADVARPSVLRELGLPPGPGLLELLEGRATMSDVLMRTNVDKLTLLPSGTPHPKATELLASDAMVRLLDDMATRYPDRIIIFDSPPLLLTTESRVLATHMGQIVVVVQADKTLRATVEQALSTIEACPVKMMLLNRARGGAGGSYGPSFGGQGYGYGYGYGYGDRSVATSDDSSVSAAGPAGVGSARSGAR